MLKLSGFGDEIDADFEVQLRELRKMDINFIALRNLWGTNILDLSEEQKQKAKALLRHHGVGVSEVGSPLGKVLITDSWEKEWARYEKAMAMAKFFGTPRIRIFSFYFPEGDAPEKHRDEVIRRLREMAERAEMENILLIHENEENIYGWDGAHCADMIRAVNSPCFKAVFDPSNFITTGSRRPYAEWWDLLKDDVVHLHVKDKKISGEQVPAGEGDGEFPKVLRGLLEKGYVGFATMEPHLSVAGQFTGFSGPKLFAHATERFRALCDQIGIRHRQTRVAVIGMGFIGGFHCKSFQEVPEAHLVAVADVVDSPNLKKAQEEYNVEAYTDVAQMLKRDDVHTVTLGTPSGLHGKLAIEAMRAGKHVLTEKPLEVTLRKADAMIATAKKHKVRLGVVSQHRTDPGIAELRDAIHSGKLGKIVLAEAYVKWFRKQEYYDSVGWRGTRKLDGGGALMNQGVHTVDMLQYVMSSPVVAVAAQTARAAHKRIEVEDVAHALLKFKNGALGMIVASTAIYPGFPERLEVTGTKGTIIVEKDRVTFREIMDEKENDKEKEKDGAEFGVGSADPKAISNRGHVLQLTDFIRAIQDNRPPLIPAKEGRKPLEIILAIYESARKGKWIKIPAR